MPGIYDYARAQQCVLQFNVFQLETNGGIDAVHFILCDA